MKRVAIALSVGLTLAECESSSDTGTPQQQSPSAGAVSPSPSPLPEPPPKPKPTEALLTDKFDVTYTVITTNVNFQGSPKTFRRVLVFDPRCASGPCDGRVTRTGKNGWDSKYLYLRQQGRYRWLRRYAAFTCNDTDIPANGEYVIRPMKVRLADDGLTWIVSKIEGSLHEEALKSGGCFPLAETRWVLRGKLAE